MVDIQAINRSTHRTVLEEKDINFNVLLSLRSSLRQLVAKESNTDFLTFIRKMHGYRYPFFNVILIILLDEMTLVAFPRNLQLT